MLRSLIAFALIAFVVGDSILTKDDQQGILDAINELRNETKAVHMNKIEYSGTLANMANTWTEKCSKKESPKLRLLFGTVFLSSKTLLKPTELVDQWQTEKKFIKRFDIEETLSAPNYTVITHENVTKMGCAAAKCSDGTYFYGCVFTPKGNHAGKFPFRQNCTVPFSKKIDCAAKGYCGVYNDGCKEVFCGPDCNRTAVTSRDTPNWKDRGMATAIKQQQQCGSCWAFATTEAVESQWAIAGGKLYTLAPQQILDCSRGGSCNGGLPYNAMQYLSSAKMSTESSYPYTGSEGSCRASQNTPVTGASGSVAKRFSNGESGIEQALAHGPVNVVLNAELLSSGAGKGYISQGCSSNQPNHAVVVYGVINNNYWLVRNSWGTDDGNAGWHYVPKGQGWCGIGSQENVAFYAGEASNDPPTPSPPSPTPSPDTSGDTGGDSGDTGGNTGDTSADTSSDTGGDTGPSPPYDPPSPTPSPPYNPPPGPSPNPIYDICTQYCQFSASFCQYCCYLNPGAGSCGSSPNAPTPSPSPTPNTPDYGPSPSPSPDYSGDYGGDNGGGWWK